MSQMVDINPGKKYNSVAKSDSEDYLTDEMSSVNPRMAAEFNQRMADVIPHSVAAEQRLELNEESERLKVIAGLMYALRKAGTHLAWAEFQQKLAKHRKKQAEAIAALETVFDYVDKRKAEGRDFKATDGVKGYYTAIDAKVSAALQEEALTDAMVGTFSILITQFSEALRILRAAFYKSKEMESIGSLSSNATEKI